MLGGDPEVLEVELDAGDASLGAGDLEVHVAEVVLVADDVGQEDVSARAWVFDQADRDPADGVGDRHAGVHQAEGRPADRGHRARAVRLQDVGDHTDRVGEDRGVGQDRSDRALGQGTVADFAAAGPPDRADLADGEARHVVVQHEGFAVLGHDPVDPLGIGAGAEDGGHEGLGLASLEDGRAVGPGEERDLAGDRAEVAGTSAVGAVAVEDQGPDDQLLDRVEGRLDLQGGDEAGAVGRCEFADDALENLLDLLVPLLLAVDRLGVADLAAETVVEVGLQRVVRDFDLLVGGEAEGVEEFVLEGQDFLVEAVGLHDRVVHLGLGKLLPEPFDHDDGLVGGGDDQVEVAVLHLGGGREGDVLVVDPAEPDGADGSHEGDLGEDQGGGGADDREDVGIILAVGGDRPGLDLDLVAEPLGEEGPDGPVDEAGGEDLLGGRPPLALDESAGEPARGVDFSR